MTTTTSRHRAYKYVPSRETDVEETFVLDRSHDGDDDNDDDSNIPGESTRLEPLEVMASMQHDLEEDDEEEDDIAGNRDQINRTMIESTDSSSHHRLFHWSRPWPLSVGVTFILSVPTLLGSIWFMYHLTGRIWTASIFILHLALTLWTARFSIPVVTTTTEQQHNNLPGTAACARWISGLASMLDVILFGFLYMAIYTAFIQIFFTEPDGTTVVEWSTLKRHLILLHIGAVAIVISRCLIGTVACWAWFVGNHSYLHAHVQRFCCCCCYFCYGCCPTCVGNLLLVIDQRLAGSSFWTERKKIQLQNRLRRLCSMLQLFALLLCSWCAYSLVVHWCDWPRTVRLPFNTNTDDDDNNNNCDPLDDTECCLPFPSFHHMRPDSTTVTGWRVNLRGKELPSLRGGMYLDPTFLNQLDGFSTMAPLLFYMNGLKEAHEQKNGTRHDEVQLQGHPHLAESVTNRSITLLLDVQARQLVHHSAEIDYLDPDRPLVLVFPAAPLKHNNHYALAVINAVDQYGIKLPPTLGMQSLHQTTGANNIHNPEVMVRFRDVVIPALERAATWFDFQQEPNSLQLLFDFHTISAESQLGPVRAVRDATMKHIQSAAKWGNWSNHVRVIRKIDNHCRVAATTNGTTTTTSVIIARTIHAELDVPWFLQGYGSGYRDAVLDSSAVASGQPTTIGKAKFVVHVPCSVRAAALNEGDEHDGLELRAVMEYGHGLFFSRAEASDHFLLRMANDNGYIIMAMDWRGMSAFDLPIVTKTLMSTPRLFQAVRDNLIQGYANKFALQHFAQNGMLSMDWLHFRSGFHHAVPIPTYQGRPPTFVFYGISQGGILGAGYTALSGPTGLIARSILGVPGTPFALIMSRSLDFAGYDQILLRNFYNNRHVRILLSLVQMAWDSVEGSGVLAPPITEPFPRILLQAGLGDSIVPTIAAEALARALGAHILPNNPFQPFGVPLALPAANDTNWNGPNVTLTELLYKPEYKSLPEDDVFAKGNNNYVHVCVRRDRKLILQIVEFINTGRVIDPCEQDGCIRERARCFQPHRHNGTSGEEEESYN